MIHFIRFKMYHGVPGYRVHKRPDLPTIFKYADGWEIVSGTDRLAFYVDLRDAKRHVCNLA